MAARRGDTLLFQTPPVVAAHAAIGGKKEGEGPLAACFDALSADNFFGQSSWEAAEKELALQTARLCLKKAQTTPEKVSLVLAGDLQAQCTASSYAMRELGIPFAGLFGACSTMAEALGLGAGRGRAAVQRRDGRRPAGHDVQPFLRGRTPVPHAAELRCGADAHGPVDGHGGGSLPAAACGRGGAALCRHLRAGAGL